MDSGKEETEMEDIKIETMYSYLPMLIIICIIIICLIIVRHQNKKHDRGTLSEREYYLKYGKYIPGGSLEKQARKAEEEYWNNPENFMSMEERELAQEAKWAQYEDTRLDQYYMEMASKQYEEDMRSYYEYLILEGESAVAEAKAFMEIEKFQRHDFRENSEEYYKYLSYLDTGYNTSEDYGDTDYND